MIKFLVLALVFSLICACNNYKVIRNYKYAPAENCDCYIYKNRITAGRLNVRKYNEKAKCNKSNYQELLDTLSLIQTALDSLMKFPNQEVHKSEIEYLKNKSKSIRNQWVKLKITVQEKEVYLNREISNSKVKRKITYYQFGLNGMKKMGKTTFLNDSVVKTTMVNSY